ncbi:hypothetical protein BDW62DRAFT_202550 [Aspergillus aurantiobrunneus]
MSSIASSAAEAAPAAVARAVSSDRVIPKFQGENFYANKRIIDGFKHLALRKKCALPQIALAWVAAQGMISIPGTTKPGRLEENCLVFVSS